MTIRTLHRNTTAQVIVAAAAITGSFVTVPAASAATTNHDLEAVVDAFETVQPFRGIAADTIGDDELELGLVTVHLDTTGEVVLHDGFVDLGSTDAGSTVIGTSDGEAMDSFAVVIDDAADESHRFDVDLPAGAVVTHEPTGAIVVTAGDETTTLAPAVAVDANGDRVPARYTIVNDQLVIEVELSGAALPAMVDPVTKYHWWGWTEWYSRADVRFQAATWSTVGSFLDRLCARAGRFAGACRAIVGRHGNWVGNTWMHAKNTNQCIEMSMTWTGQITSVKAYSCNW